MGKEKRQSSTANINQTGFEINQNKEHTYANLQIEMCVFNNIANFKYQKIYLKFPFQGPLNQFQGKLIFHYVVRAMQK